MSNTPIERPKLQSARTKPPFRRSVFGGGISLQFTDEAEYNLYAKEIWLAEMRAYERQRNRNGIWADNQNKFVTSVDEFNSWDSLSMEVQYQRYLKEVAL